MYHFHYKGYEDVRVSSTFNGDNNNNNPENTNIHNNISTNSSSSKSICDSLSSSIESSSEQSLQSDTQNDADGDDRGDDEKFFLLVNKKSLSDSPNNDTTTLIKGSSNNIINKNDDDGDEDHHNKNHNNNNDNRKRDKDKLLSILSLESGTVLYFTKKTLLGFFLLGIINNIIYVIMIAGAKEINSGGVALVFLANIAPSLVVKGTGPYWFHLVSYRMRVIIAGLFAVISLILVALGNELTIQLIGVCFSALQSSLGEASILALSSKYASLSRKNSTLVITFWSSGTGFAGVLGFAWVNFFNTFLNLSFKVTLLIGLVLPVFWWLTYFNLIEYNRYFDDKNNDRSCSSSYCIPTTGLTEKKQKFSRTNDSVNLSDSKTRLTERESININDENTSSSSYSSYYDPPSPSVLEGDIKLLMVDQSVKKTSVSTNEPINFTFKEKIKIMLSLWRFMIPLIVVYLAEYCLQSGIWPGIGIPEIQSEDDRKNFYNFSNWLYQVGVLISRSSGTLIPPSTSLLWVLAGLQIVMAIFFTCVAMFQLLLGEGVLLYILCVFVGLLGGSVYVSGFSQICNKSKPEEKEISMAIASISDTLGICLADIFGLFIQGCLYRYNNIPGATFQCGSN